jgi:glycosyltransferase involved in cell wall biosynthesis
VGKRVLIDGRLLGYRHGGIATYARQLATHIPPFARELDVRLASCKDTGSLSDRTVTVFTPPHHRFERWAFGFELTVHRPALLHAVDYARPATLGIRTVATVHDLAFLTYPDFVTADSYAYYSRGIQSLHEVDVVIAVSEWTRTCLIDLSDVDPERIRVVPNGYDPEIFRSTGIGDNYRLSRMHPLLMQVIDDARPVILMVGTIEPRKRHEIIFNAFQHQYDAICQKAGAEPVLVVAGQKGWLTDVTVSALRLLQRDGKAIWLRQTSDRELATLYRAATLLVMPSADEGFGLPVLESMASGTPCLVSDKGALPDLVGDCGFLEASTAPESWADKIGRILSDHEVRERCARRSIEHAETFTWQSTARRTLDVYREVLNG